MDPSIELEPINEAAAHAAAREGWRGVDEFATLILRHGPTNAAAIWLRASWLWTNGLERGDAEEAA